MELRNLLFNFNGRIGQRKYWQTILPLFATVHLVAFAPVLITGSIVGTESDEMPNSILIAIMVAQLVWFAGLWPLFAVGCKRLHDRNKPGGWLIIWWLLPLILFFGGFGYDFTNRSDVPLDGITTGLMLMSASLPLLLWGIVEMGILPGTKGVNRYGADPV